MDSPQPLATNCPAKSLIVISKIVAFLLLGVVIIAFLLAWSCKAPSDESLRERFQSHRSELETLARMSQEDADVIRVTDNFTRLKNDWSWPRPESKWGITRERWDEYQRLFRKIGLSAGLEKDKLGNVFFIAHTEGFASHGASKGLVQCVSGKDHDNAYLPCVEQYEHGQQGQHDGY